MTRLAPLLVLAIAGCGRGFDCCETPDCSEGAKTTEGSEVLRFRGKVPSNLWILSIDTLRKDHVGTYRPADVESYTPFLDRLATEGVVMRDHLQCSNWTYASMTCTVGGRYNLDREHMPRFDSGPVPEGTPLLARWLGDAGFVTSVVTANNWFSSRENNTEGYAHYKRMLDTPADDVIRAGAKRIRRQAGRADRWFLHTHVMDPHLPYDPPDEYREVDPDLEPWPDRLDHNRGQGYWRRIWPELDDDEKALLEAHTRLLYQGDVRSVDDRIREVFEELDADCMLDDTLVVILNDHGEGFWEHGTHAHAHNLTAEENDGVLLFWAKNLEAGEWTGTTSTIDLVPTLLDLYGIDLPREVTGMPIGTAPPDRAVFGETVGYDGPVQAVTAEGWKLQYHWRSGVVRMWDRNRDPLETQVLMNPTGDRAEALWAELRPRIDAMESALPDDYTRVAPPGLP